MSKYLQVTTHNKLGRRTRRRHPTQVFKSIIGLFALCTNIECPQISKATATHSAVDYQARLPRRLLRVDHGSVALARRRQNAIRDWNIPTHNTGTGTKLECVQIVQVSLSRTKTKHKLTTINQVF